MINPKQRRFGNNGFTLIELMITLIILSVLLGLAAPAFVSVIRENQVRTQASKIMSSLNLARTTSAKENVPVVMCASADSSTCSGDEADFLSGWLVYADRDRNGSLTSLATELVRTYEGLPNNYVLVFDNDSAAITYFPDGSTSGEETIVTCPPDRDNARAWSVIIGAVGGPRMRRPDGGLNCS
jgi:type IV fimbrial biogenesis protein FimT